MAGGLARRAHMVESVRKDERAVLLLDGGDVFDHRRDAAELSLKAMALMRYDAMNLGSREFLFGRELLEHTRSLVPFPYIASNLLYEGGRLPWIREYVVLETGGMKVAILGVSDPADLAHSPKQEQIKGLAVTAPEEALNRLLPEVRGKADLVVLLSGLGAQETLALVRAARGVDVAISSGYDSQFFGEMPENTILLHTGYLGRELGLLKITLDEKRTLSVIAKKRLLLDNTIPDNAEIAGLIDPFKKAQEKKAADLVKEQAKLQEKEHRELMEGLKLSPQEFMERLQQEQMRKGETR